MWKAFTRYRLPARLASLRERANELPDTVKVGMLLGGYTDKLYQGYFYFKAQNLRRRLRAAYDAALTEHDLILMPTTRMMASKIPPADAPFDATHAAQLGADRQHLPVQRHGPSFDFNPVWTRRRRASRRADADWKTLAGVDALSSCARIRGSGEVADQAREEIRKPQGQKFRGECGEVDPTWLVPSVIDNVLTTCDGAAFVAREQIGSRAGAMPRAITCLWREERTRQHGHDKIDARFLNF